MSNFISNGDAKTLKKRLNQLIPQSEQLKFLVGFFYFSGFKELFESLKENENLIMKVLVGLEVDEAILKTNSMNILLEKIHDSGTSNNENKENFFNSIKKSLNSDDYDSKEEYEKIKFYIKMILENRLIIRKTLEPNHSKLYIFCLKDKTIRDKVIITGSSNLTKSGLKEQNEFNVEISDYGTDEAEKYFDNLWDDATQITENKKYRDELIYIINNETHLCEITPYEAYCLALKSYIDLYEYKNIDEQIIETLKEKGYTPYSYQIDAVKMAINIIEKNNGILIADVVGLGKTIIACMIAKHLGKKGIVICPPGLMGDDNLTTIGWKKYINDFELPYWQVRSLGDLEGTLKFLSKNNDIEVVIVDEAHRFRNEDTQSYELLHQICRNRKVMLLTATPFNNRPQDVLSLLHLFIIPNKSEITLNNDLLFIFRELEKEFYDMAYIIKNCKSSDIKTRNNALRLYQKYFDENVIDLSRVKRKTSNISKKIRDIIQPVTIRRNRLDLIKNPKYKDEMNAFPRTNDPLEWFYELTEEQMSFYDEVIMTLFGDIEDNFVDKKKIINKKSFSGAIYRPFYYENDESRKYDSEVYQDNYISENGSSYNKKNNESSYNKKNIESSYNKKNIENSNKNKEQMQKEYINQKNLTNLMRRLLIKRFESSFGSFASTVKRFIDVYEKVLRFINKTGKFILNRDLLEKLVDKEVEEIEKELIDFANNIELYKENDLLPKNYKIYNVNDFKYKDEFLSNINDDLNLFNYILTRIKELKLDENDPKADCLIKKIKEELSKKIHSGKPKSKIVIFTEYKDTVNHLDNYITSKYPDLRDRTLCIYGNIANIRIEDIQQNFDASIIEEEQQDLYDILITTDKLSEGFNLNRANIVINYDIPWNPVRVIQRYGRINRISKKVFDELFIVNFFPTEKGAKIIKSREIAQNKMFMIHKTLGEDSKIFDIDEEPTAAELYQKINKNPDELEEEDFYTKVYAEYEKIKNEDKDIFERLNKLPKRIKLVKKGDEESLIAIVKKGRLFVNQITKNNEGFVIENKLFEEIYDKIKASKDEKGFEIDDEFWKYYEKFLEEFKKITSKQREISDSSQSLENKSLNLIKSFIQKNDSRFDIVRPFLRMLREDMLEYCSLPTYTLRRIVNLDGLADDVIIEELQNLQKFLGEDYLNKIKERIKENQKEIIISIMNKRIN